MATIRVYPQQNSPMLQLRTKLKLNQQALKNQKQQTALQLNYERALWQQKMQTQQLQTQMQYQSMAGLGNGMLGAGGANSIGTMYTQLAMLSAGNNFWAGLGLGGMFR